MTRKFRKHAAVTTDGIKVSHSRALVLISAKLVEAARLFETLEPDVGPHHSQYTRLKVGLGVAECGGEEFVVEASLAFYDALVKAYDEMETE